MQSPFAATMLESLPVDNPRTFQQMFPNASPEATDLVSKLLQFNPDKVRQVLAVVSCCLSFLHSQLCNAAKYL